MSAASRPLRRPSRFWPALLVLSLSLAACSGDNMRANLVKLQQKEQAIAAIRSGLLLAVDQEKNALLSPSQAEAKQFLEAAHDAMAGLRRNLGRLTQLVEETDGAKETAALHVVTTDFEDMASVDEALRSLAGRNTNLRAARLSRTEAALAASRLQQALTPIIDAADCQASRDALRIVTAALSVLALHAQHIDEKTVAGMDNLETAMNRQNTRAQESFDRLTGLLAPSATAALDQAKTAYADFWRVTREIIALSRENTNIEAEALAMGKKRRITAKALVDLTALQDVVARQEFSATR